MGITIGTILRNLRRSYDYQQQDVADELNAMGIKTAKTQISRWENGHNNPTIEQFVGLCRIYAIKDVYKVFGQQDFSDLVHELNREGTQKLEEFKFLLIASGLYAPIRDDRRILSLRKRTVPMYDIGASAGTGQFLDSDSYEMIEVPEDVPDSANFALHVCGDSMEPNFQNGEALWVHQQPTLENGDIGIFLLDGDAFVKEYSITDDGMFLISHNPNYAPIQVKSFNELRIYGKVVFPHC